jgi:hypothetical protein
MRDWKWPTVALISVLIGALAWMFNSTDDTALQERILDNVDAVTVFVLGALSGATVGAAVGYLRGRTAAQRAAGTVQTGP